MGEVERAVDYARAPRPRRPPRGSPTRTQPASTRAALEALELADPVDQPTPARAPARASATRSVARRAPGKQGRRSRRAASLARELERPEEMATAVLGICMLSEAGVIDEHLVALLEEALEAIGPEDGPMRSQLLGGLAQELYWTDAAGRSDELGLEALEIARRIGDPAALATALIRRQFTGSAGPGAAERRLRESDELHDLAKSLGDIELELRAHLYRLRDRLELGDVRGVDADLVAIERLVGEVRQPQYAWQPPLLRAMRALLDGHFDEAERLAEEALAGGRRAQEPVSAQFYATQIGLLRRLRRSAEDDAQLDDLVSNSPASPSATRRFRRGAARSRRRWPSSVARARRERPSTRSRRATSRTSRSTPSGRSRSPCSPRRPRSSATPSARSGSMSACFPTTGSSWSPGGRRRSTVRSPDRSACSR